MIKHGSIIILIACLSITLGGCPKKTVKIDEPYMRGAEQLAIEKEKAAALEAERREREAALEAERREREAALEAERREREAKEIARIKEKESKKAAASREFEKSLVAKKTPGVEGTIFESRLLKDIYFDFDRYEIRPENAEVLKENAAVLMKYPSIKIQIEGHCDERGTAEYNLALGQRRANSTKNYLISLGTPEDRISTISYGEERPFDTGHHEEAWGKNRRAHFVILSK